MKATLRIKTAKKMRDDANLGSLPPIRRFGAILAYRLKVSEFSKHR